MRCSCTSHEISLSIGVPFDIIYEADFSFPSESLSPLVFFFGICCWKLFAVELAYWGSWQDGCTTKVVGALRYMRRGVNWAGWPWASPVQFILGGLWTCPINKWSNWTKDQLVYGPIGRRPNGQWVFMSFLKHIFIGLTKESIVLQFKPKKLLYC